MFVYRCHVKQFQKSIFCLSEHKLSELVHPAAGLLAPAYMLWTSILEIVSSYTIFSSLTSVASIIFESWVQHHFGNYWRHTTFGSPCIVNSWINTDKEKKTILFSLYGQSNWINDCTGSTENTLSAGQAAGVTSCLLFSHRPHGLCSTTSSSSSSLSSPECSFRTSLIPSVKLFAISLLLFYLLEEWPTADSIDERMNMKTEF